MSIEFQPWPKIARLNRDCIITEKIDGTNAAVGIVREQVGHDETERKVLKIIAQVEHDGSLYSVYSQSRKRLITPEDDNYGFARYVASNAEAFVSTLGEGLHFGEWWGSKIARNYGFNSGERFFSLFNTPRYGKPEWDLSRVPGLDIVPVLYEGPFSSEAVRDVIHDLEVEGSKASLGFPNPEGVIVFHVAAQMPFKVTIENDEKPKGSKE